MGKKTGAAKQAADDKAARQARLDAMRRGQAGRERRRRLGLIGGAGALALVLVAVVVVTIVRQQQAQDPANIGVAAAAAGCGPVEGVPVEGVSEHIGPGTSEPDVETIDYAQVPAISGKHFVSPAYPAAAFYTAADSPPVEHLVHNLEHGYTVAWYAPSLPEADVTALEAASEAMRRLEETQRGKFIAAPWPEDREPMPAETPLALAHWGSDDGALQFCGAVSGEVLVDFVEAHPADDSPEPNGA